MAKKKRIDRTEILVAAIAALATIVAAYWQFVWKPSQEVASTPTPLPTPTPTPFLTPTPQQVEYIGRVIDGNTEAPIRGAKVTLDFQGAPPIVYTDSEGVYTFAVRFVARRLVGRVRVEATGYQIYDRFVELPSDNTGIEDIRLSPLPPTPTSFPIESIIIAKADKYYRIEVTSYNPLQRDILVTHVDITKHTQWFNLWCCCGEIGHYVLSDQIAIVSTGQESIKFATTVSPITGELSRHEYTGQGLLTVNCADWWLELGFDASFLLTAGAHTAFFIDIPKVFNVAEDKSHGGDIEYLRATGAYEDRGTIPTHMVPNTDHDGWYLYPLPDVFDVTVVLVTDVGQASHTRSLVE